MTIKLSCNRNSRNCELSPKKRFPGLTGFEPVASAFALQCSTNWAIVTRFNVLVEMLTELNRMYGCRYQQQADLFQDESSLHSLRHFCVTQTLLLTQHIARHTATSLRSAHSHCNKLQTYCYTAFENCFSKLLE